MKKYFVVLSYSFPLENSYLSLRELIIFNSQAVCLYSNSIEKFLLLFNQMQYSDIMRSGQRIVFCFVFVFNILP